MKKSGLKAPKAVKAAAKRGLILRKKFHRGGLTAREAHKLGIGSGIVRAANLAKGRVSLQTVKRMHNYFSRHRKDRRKGWSNPKNPSNGYIAWLLWGGDAGKRWADNIVKSINNFLKKKK